MELLLQTKGLTHKISTTGYLPQRGGGGGGGCDLLEILQYIIHYYLRLAYGYIYHFTNVAQFWKTAV